MVGCKRSRIKIMKNLFSRSELVEILCGQISQRGIDDTIKKRNDAGLFSLSGRTLANGKPEKLYKFSDLPKKWQKRLEDRRQSDEITESRDHEITNGGNRDHDAGEPPALRHGSEKSPEFKAVESGTPNDEDTNKPIKKVQEQSKEQKNFQGAAFGSSTTGLPAGICEAVSITVKMGGTVKENAMISAVMDIENRKGSVKEAVEAVMRTYGVSRATVYNWINAVKGKPDEENGEVQVYNTTVGYKVHTHTTCSEAIDYMMGTRFLNPRVTKQFIVEKTIEKAAAEGWRVGSKATLMRLLAKATSDARPAIALIQGGTQKFTKEYAPLLRRDMTKYKPMDHIVGDQHIFDFLVFDDKGHVCRPECYLWVDMGSRLVVGFHATLTHYNSGDVALALYEACRFGIPKGIYTDMGKPELSNYVETIARNLTTLTEIFAPSEDFEIPGMEELVDAEGAARFFRFEQIEHKVAIGRRPNSKPIEGYFAIFEKKLFDLTGGIGYCKRVSDPDENLKIIAEAEKNKKSKKLLTYTEFFKYVFKVFDWWNKHEISTDHIVPEKWFFENLGHVFRPDDQHLDFMLLPEKVCTVRQSKIKLNGTEYFHPALARLSGNGKWEHRVWVKYHPEDRERVHIFTYEPEGRKRKYIGMPEVWDKIDPRNEEEVADRMKAQKTVEKMWREFINKTVEKGECLKKQSTARLALDDAAEHAERTENTMRIVKEAKKRMSQKEADELFLNGGKVG